MSTTATDLAKHSKTQDDRPLVAGGWMAPITFLKTFIIKLNHDECPMRASAMAFGFLGAIVPTLIFGISILGLVGHQKETITMLIQALSSFAPDGAVNLLKETIDGIVKSSSKGLSILGLLTALWSSSRGASVIVNGLDRAYNIPLEKRPFWYEPLVSVLIVFSLGVVLIIVSNLIFFGEPLIQWLVETGHLPLKSKALLQVGRWGISVLSVLSCSTLIYGLLLKLKLRDYYWRAAAIGSLVFTAIWLGVSLLFGLYIHAFHSYNPVYGSLGAIVFLLTWLYLSAMSILIAGEVISILAIPKEAVEIAAESAKAAQSSSITPQ